MNEIIEQINQWLSEPGNTKSKLASLLHYNSTATIDYWISNGRVPEYQITNLRRIFDAAARRKRSCADGKN